MNTNKIKVVVLSNDYRFKNPLAIGLQRDPALEVIFNVMNLLQAKTILDKTTPTIFIIDIETLPVTDIYLKSLLENHSLKVILTGAKPTIAFLSIGIKDFIRKPVADNTLLWQTYLKDITKRIQSLFIDLSVPPTIHSFAAMPGRTDKLVVIAASTGGTEALPVLLSGLPAQMPPILIVQHMPSNFTRQFAERIDKMSKITVREAVNGEFIRPGTALIAPGDLHMKAIKKASRVAIEIFFAEKLHGVRPAADILFHSVLDIANPKDVVGVILTGMGADGARGLLELHNKGARVIAQDKESCVVFGMPKVACDLGATDYVLPLNQIPAKIMELV